MEENNKYTFEENKSTVQPISLAWHSKMQFSVPQKRVKERDFLFATFSKTKAIRSA